MLIYFLLFAHTFPRHAPLRLGPPCEGGLCGGLLKGPPKPAEGSAGSLKHSNGASENLSKSLQPTLGKPMQAYEGLQLAQDMICAGICSLDLLETVEIAMFACLKACSVQISSSPVDQTLTAVTATGL